MLKNSFHFYRRCKVKAQVFKNNTPQRGYFAAGMLKNIKKRYAFFRRVALMCPNRSLFLNYSITSLQISPSVPQSANNRFLSVKILR
jgi:hypothetical protein